jgi:hypothetical protein
MAIDKMMMKNPIKIKKMKLRKIIDLLVNPDN